MVSTIASSSCLAPQLKMVGLQDLQKHLPDSTLPPSLGGSLLPSRAVTATAGAQALESPVRTTNKKLPMAPPRQRPPERRQSFPDMTSIETSRQSAVAAAHPPTGAVNRMKDLFEQKKEDHTVSPQRKPHNGASSKPNPPSNKPLKIPPVPPQRTPGGGASGHSSSTDERSAHIGDKGRITAGKVALTVLNIGSSSKATGPSSKATGPSSKATGLSSKANSDRPTNSGSKASNDRPGNSSSDRPTGGLGNSDSRPPPSGGKKKPTYNEYETVEITPMPTSPTKSRNNKQPAARSTPARPKEPPAPPPTVPPASKSAPKSQYENIQIKRTSHYDGE